MEWLPEQHLKTQNPDLTTLEEHCKAFSRRKETATRRSPTRRMSRASHECGASGRSKKVSASPRRARTLEGARALWRRWLVSRFDVRRLVFVDESATHTSMGRLRSRAPKGERAYYTRQQGALCRNRHAKNTTLS